MASNVLVGLGSFVAGDRVQLLEWGFIGTVRHVSDHNGQITVDVPMRGGKVETFYCAASDLGLTDSTADNDNVADVDADLLTAEDGIDSIVTEADHASFDAAYAPLENDVDYWD